MRRSIVLLTLAVTIIVVATVQVTPVSAAASISPDPTWNKLYNGDFEQGTYSLGDFGNCPNSWTQTNSYFDPSYRLTPHYDVVYETTHGNGHASPTDDNYRLEITASCAGDFWNNAWVEEDVYQNTGDHLITPTTVFYGSIMLINNYVDSEATSGAYRIKIYCHDDLNGYGTWVYLDYRLRETSGGYNYGEARDHKIIDLIMSVGCWEGVSDYPTGYTGRNLYQDVHNKFDSEGFSNYYYCAVYCVAWAKCVWLAGSTGTYAFDGVRIGEYPTAVASSASPTETDSGSVDFAWTCDTPTCMFQNGYDGNYGVLRGGVSSYRVYIDSSHYSSTTSTSTTYDFSGISKGRYTPYVVAKQVGSGEWGPSSSFSEVLNGYALTVNTYWRASATGTATLTYNQHGTTKTHDLTNTATSWSVIVDPSSTASVPTDVSYSAGNYRVHTYDTRSWTISSSCTKDIYYYKQYWSSITTSGLISSYPATVSVVQGATTNNPTTYGTWSDWADYNSNLKINSTVNVSGTRRYHTLNTVSWTVNSYPFSKSVQYYCQWKPTVTISGLPDSSHWANATYTQDGSSVISPNWWSGTWGDWVDNNTILQFSPDSKLSTSAERWHVYGASWTIRSAATPSATYVHQLYITLDPRDERGSPLGRTVDVQYSGDDGSNGASGTYTTTFSSAWSRWINYGTMLRDGKLTSGSNLTDQWYSYDGSLNGNWRERAVSSSVTYTLTFYHQFRPEIELYTIQYGEKVYDNAWWLSPYDWIQASAYLNESDSQPPIVGTYTFTFTDPSGVPHVVDGSATGSCFYQIPQARGAWTLRVTWDDGSGTVIYNKTVGFYVWDYDVELQSLVQSGNNLNITVYVNQLSGAMSAMQDYGYVVVVTGGSGSGIYTNATGFTFANGFMSVGVSSVSTKFFFPAGMWLWSAHMINLDPYLAHVVGVRVLVVDPITGYIYVNTTSTKSLSIGGEGDLQIQFTANPNWYKHGLFRVYYTFLLYDVSGATLLTSKTVDYGNNSPLSWIMRGTGEGEIRTVYYFIGLHNSTTLTQIPVSLLAPSTTAHFYLAFEDSHALSTQSQVSPAVMRYINITFVGGNVFATGCVPPSTWVSEGNVTLSVDSPFYPKPPYYSNTTRFIFLGWKWTYASSYPQWASCNSTTLIVDVTQPIQVVAYWRTQYLIEYTPYVPTTAPTDTVEISYTVNATLTNMSVKSASTVRVWVDAYTFFTMHDLWVNDYIWYGVNYDTSSKNVTGGASLTLPYVEKTNKVSDTTIESNSFEAGGTLNFNLTLTTTYFNAQWINVTVMVASENAILVDRNGLTWGNMRIQLQNNTALITIPLPADIGNGTLTVILTAYGKVEPSTKQVTLHSPLAPPGQGQLQGGVDLMAIAFTVTSLGGLLGASLFIRKWRRAGRHGSNRSTSNATATSTTTTAATASDGAPIISSLSGAGIIEFHEERGPHLKMIVDKDSRFLNKLKSDPGMCVRYHGTRPLVIQDPEGEHVAFLSYTNNSRGRGHEAERGIEGRRSGSRTVKSTLVLCSRECNGTDIMKVADELSQLGNDRSIRLKLVFASRDGSHPLTRQNSGNSSSSSRHGASNS